MKDNPNKLFIGTNLQNDDSDFIPLIGDEDDDHVVVERRQGVAHFGSA